MAKIENARVWFASMNTGHGFKSFFGEIFDPLERVYVIKGGSGTGKSRLMRELCEKAEMLGYTTEAILCSSDPTSLDGLIVKELGVGIVDGTAPHVHEPTLIGARESIVDLSAFLDHTKLKPKRDEISALLEAKAFRYKRVYEYLKVISVYDEAIKELYLRCTDKEKISKIASRYLGGVRKSAKYEKNVRIRSAVCENDVVLDTYARISGVRVAVSECAGIGNVFLSELVKQSDALGLSATVSYSPYFPTLPDAVYYPDTDTSFYVGVESDFEESHLNIKRAVNDKLLRAFKPEIRAINRLKSGALEQMRYDIRAVRRLHGELENIYMSAMCFTEKECLTQRLSKEIFGC